MPVAVANTGARDERRHSERRGDAREREVKALEELLDEVRALDQIAHEDEQGIEIRTSFDITE
jgi:hypothetical protein